MIRRAGVLLLSFFLYSCAATSASSLTLHFFYAENCPSCRQEKPYVEGLAQRYPQLQVQIHDVWLQRDSYELMEAWPKLKGSILPVPRSPPLAAAPGSASTRKSPSKSRLRCNNACAPVVLTW